MSERIAKSNFSCTWCGEPIRKGEIYFTFPNYVEDRGFCGRSLHHPECQHAMLDNCVDQWALRSFIRGSSTSKESLS